MEGEQTRNNNNIVLCHAHRIGPALGSKHKTRQFQAAEELGRSRPWRGCHFKEGQHHAPAFLQQLGWDSTACMCACVVRPYHLSFFGDLLIPPEPFFFKGTVPTSHSGCVCECVCGGTERACSVVRNWALSLSPAALAPLWVIFSNRFPTPHREPSICPRSGQE